ncbi:MAG: hypothetical protein ACREOZ_01980, partial [Gloeomargaritales cyanobacterium]
RKNGNKKRKRLEWKAHVQDIGEDIFRRAYRLTYDAFNSLLVKITPFITAIQVNALNPSDSNVPPEICLASALRWLAGGQYIDICIIFGIGSTTCYDCIWTVAGAIDRVEKFDFPTDDVNKMKTISSKDFGKRSGGVMDGCIGALDRFWHPYSKMGCILATFGVRYG